MGASADKKLFRMEGTFTLLVCLLSLNLSDFWLAQAHSSYAIPRPNKLFKILYCLCKHVYMFSAST